MRRVAPSFALMLCLLGCNAVPVPLLTGSREMCYAGPGPLIEGLLIPDDASGTAMVVDRSEERYPYEMPSVGSVVPIMWPTGYTARRSWFGVEVLNGAGDVVAATGNRYALEPPVPLGDTNPSYHSGGPWPACGVF
jgi:hypothetical protein